jgi:hypothetical protein
MRRLLIGGGHAVPLAALLAILHGPTWVSVEPSGGDRPTFQVLIDRSASMTAQGSSGRIESRFAQAVRLHQENAPRWSKHVEARVNMFDRSFQPVTAQADGVMTDIAAGLDGALASGSPPAAVLLFSDGIHNGEDDPVLVARRSRALGCPIYTVTLGSDAAVQDLGVVLAEADALTFVRQPYRALVTLTHRGLRNVEAVVTVRLGDHVVQKRRVPIENSGEISLDFLLAQEKAGVYEYQIAVEEREGEIFRSNNRQTLHLRVVDEKIRVLVLEGKPYWDSKFLLQALRRDANVSVTSLVRVNESKVLFDRNPGEPPIAPKDLSRPLEDRKFLDLYQVVVLGKDVDGFLTPASVNLLKQWVAQRSGHLVCARGRPTGGLSRDRDFLALLPVVWAPAEEQRFRMELTERGKMVALFSSSRKESGAKEEDPRVLLRSLPTLVTATRVEKERALAVVLARGSGTGPVQEMATVSYHTYGSGRIVAIEGQGLWRWAFQPEETPAAKSSAFETFWSNLIRWLVGSNDFLPSQMMSMRAGKTTYGIDERPVIYIMERNATIEELSLQVHREGGTPEDSPIKFPLQVQALPSPDDPTLRRSVLEPLPEGRYSVHLDKADSALDPVKFEVIPPLQEKLDLRARSELMRRIAQASDGEALTPAQVPDLLEHYARYVSRFRPELERRTPAWDRFWIWALLIAWFGGLWYVRRRWAMI